MQRGVNDAHTCRLNGWTAGTILHGINYGDPIFIKITVIGEERVLVRFLDSEFGAASSETLFSLGFNDWEKVRLPDRS